MKTALLKQTLAAALVLTGTVFVSAADAPAAKAAPAAAKKDAKTVKPAPAKPAPAKPAVTFESALSFLPDTVAEYNGKKITKAQLIATLKNSKMPAEVFAQIPQQQLKGFLKQSVKEMIEADLLAAKAKAAGIVPSAALVKKMLKESFDKLPQQQRDMFLANMKAQGKTFEAYQNEVASNPEIQKRSAILQYFEKELFAKANIKVTPADVEKFYRENQKEFEIPETITVSHILALVKADDKDGKPLSADALKKADAAAKAKIDKVYAKLKQGAKFEDLAKAESDCPSGKNSGGKLPAFDKNGAMQEGGAMDPVFTANAFKIAKAGQTSAPFKTQFGWHIVRLEKKTAAQFTPLDKVQAGIQNFLINQQKDALIRKTIEAADKEANVKYFGFDAPAAPAKSAPAKSAPAKSAPAKSAPAPKK